MLAFKSAIIFYCPTSTNFLQIKRFYPLPFSLNLGHPEPERLACISRLLAYSRSRATVVNWGATFNLTGDINSVPVSRRPPTLSLSRSLLHSALINLGKPDSHLKIVGEGAPVCADYISKQPRAREGGGDMIFDGWQLEVLQKRKKSRGISSILIMQRTRVPLCARCKEIPAHARVVE